MILNHDRSKTLHVWSVIFLILGIIFLVVGFGLSIFKSTFDMLEAGLCLLVLAPILNGLSVLVEDAEVRLIERSENQLRLEKERQSRPAE